MKETDKSYIAGYFDGEGCIGIWRRKPMKDKSKGYSSISVRHILQVQISSTDERTLRWIQSLLGGTVSYHHVKSVDKQGYKHANAWKWMVICKKAGKVLELILPYLRMKKKEAELSLELQKDMQEHLHKGHIKGGKRGILPVPKKRMVFRDRIWTELKTLKHKHKTYG